MTETLTQSLKPLSTWFLNDGVTGVGNLLPLCFIWVLVLHEEAVRDKQPQHWKQFNHTASQATHLLEDGTSLSSASYALILHLINF